MNSNNPQAEDKTIVIQIPVTFSRKFGRRWMLVPPSEDIPLLSVNPNMTRRFLRR